MLPKTRLMLELAIAGLIYLFVKEVQRALVLRRAPKAVKQPESPADWATRNVERSQQQKTERPQMELRPQRPQTEQRPPWERSNRVGETAPLPYRGLLPESNRARGEPDNWRTTASAKQAAVAMRVPDAPGSWDLSGSGKGLGKGSRGAQETSSRDADQPRDQAAEGVPLYRNVQLNREIVAAASAVEILILVADQEEGVLNAVNTATAVHRVARAMRSASSGPGKVLCRLIFFMCENGSELTATSFVK